MKIFTKINILLVIFFSPFSPIYASLEINEIMYDLKTGSDEGREWIEVFNNSAEEIDISSFVFFEAGVNHKLVLKQGSAKIPPLGYAVIVANDIKFKNDWPSFSGAIFDSTFSLSNTGEMLAIKDGDSIIDQFIYSSSMGASGDGNSLQKINGSWVASAPTPGRENKYLPPAPKVIPQKEILKKEIPATSFKIENVLPNENLAILPEIEAPTTDFKTQPLLNNVGKEENNFIYFSFFVLLVSMGAWSVYFVRKNKGKSEIGDDFEILEE